MKEIEIKKIFLEHNLNTSIIAGLEVPFSSDSRADITFIEDEKAHGYEIKGLSDDASRLISQIPKYKEYFDFVSIICEPENLNIIRRYIPAGVGLITVSKKRVVVIRKAKEIKRQIKVALLGSINQSKLKSVAKNSSLRSKEEHIKYLSEELSLKECKSLSRSDLKNKLSHRYKLFKSELGTVLHTDDLQTLSRQAPLVSLTQL